MPTGNCLFLFLSTFGTMFSKNSLLTRPSSAILREASERVCISAVNIWTDALDLLVIPINFSLLRARLPL